MNELYSFATQKMNELLCKYTQKMNELAFFVRKIALGLKNNVDLSSFSIDSNYQNSIAVVIM